VFRPCFVCRDGILFRRGCRTRFVDATLQPPGRSGGAPPRDPRIVLAHPPVLARVGGAALGAGGVHRIAAGELARGVPIVLAGRVVLWLTTDHDRRGDG
jgi:hypothetical protein